MLGISVCFHSFSPMLQFNILWYMTCFVLYICRQYYLIFVSMASIGRVLMNGIRNAQKARVLSAACSWQQRLPAIAMAPASTAASATSALHEGKPDSSVFWHFILTLTNSVMSLL